ncbi:hypothetical protein Droror1_Dr00008975 [Drosera rotundifolia]
MSSSSLSKLGIIFTSLSALFFLALIFELLFILLRRRRRLHSNQIRIEPSGPTTEGSGQITPEINVDVSELMKLSRGLFTIKEEEKEETGSLERSEMERVGAVVEVETETETPFESPCGSPMYFFTPAPSPGRMER